MEDYKNYESKEVLESDYDNYKSSWVYDAKSETAKHQSGLEIRKVFDKIEFRNLSEWLGRMRQSGMDDEQMREYRIKLSNQFVIVHKHQGISPHQRTPEERRKDAEKADQMRLDMAQEHGYTEEQLKIFAARMKKEREEMDY